MNQTQKDEQSRERRFFNSRWKLVAYDLFICLIVEILFLLVYKGTPDNLGSMDVLIHMLIVTSAIFGMRAGGFGSRGIQGMILAAKYAREHDVPYFGICLVMQIAVIEFARDVV